MYKVLDTKYDTSLVHLNIIRYVINQYGLLWMRCSEICAVKNCWYVYFIWINQK